MDYTCFMNAQQSKLFIERVNRLIDEYRTSCFWFARPDFFASTCEEAQQALRQIENHGTRAMFMRAAEVRQWLSPNPNSPSVN